MRSSAVPLTAAFLALVAAPAAAVEYPSKPVHVIVVFPPGGSNDVTARIVFKKLEDNLKQQFIIDNRAGAAGTIGATSVANSAADGYTVMVQSTTHVANAYMYKGKLAYDTLGDFIGVTPLARQVGAGRASVHAGQVGQRSDRARRETAGRNRFRIGGLRQLCASQHGDAALQDEDQDDAHTLQGRWPAGDCAHRR